MIDVTDPAAVRREAERRQQLRDRGATSFDASAAVELPDVDEGALEKVIEHEGDKIMRALGFLVVRFSHPGKTKQTPGIPDRRYYRRPRTASSAKMPDGRTFDTPGLAITLWWEAKSATGSQRPEQKLFQEMVEACGETYVLGTHEALIAWLVEQRIAALVNGVLEPLA